MLTWLTLRIHRLDSQQSLWYNGSMKVVMNVLCGVGLLAVGVVIMAFINQLIDEAKEMLK
jgi:hypothetical protein